MIEIELTQGFFTKIDDVDSELILGYKWHTIKVSGRYFYAVRTTHKNGVGRQVFMHREIMGLTFSDKEKIVDHINRDTLDNRRFNLRVCSTRQNSWNTRASTGGTSAYKGVSWNKQRGVWTAIITIDKKQFYLGSFNSEVEAALAYNKMASKYFGEFAYLNTFEEAD
jgi:hypothetical protein